MFNWIRPNRNKTVTDPSAPSSARTAAADPRRWPNWPRGSLPHSRRLADTQLYRYQPREYLDLGTSWYRMVWDLEHKWHASGRYAGREIAPGHFFGANIRTAKAERHAYTTSSDDAVLLEFTVSIDNLLDLTDTTALSWFYKTHFEPDRDWHWALILDSLFNQQLGGDSHNSFAGHRALLDGYNGIVFFSAREVDRWWADPGSMRDRDLDLVGLYHDGLVQQGRINVVIFFGHNVVCATHRLASHTTTIDNPLFGAAMDDIDRVFAGDPIRPDGIDLSYQALRQRVDGIGWVQTPRIVEELRSARTGQP